MIQDQPELALDLSNILGGLPSHGYVVISNLPRGSRLSHGYDSGDDTWTLMVDELPGLKFLPGPVRGIVSLRAQIFVPTAGGVISTGSTTIMDVGTLRMPTRGWYVLSTGEDMELNGAVPHHTVWPEPGQFAAGKDAQVEKAVEVLMAELKKNPPVKPKRPAFPNKVVP